MLLWTDASGFVVLTQLIAYDSFKVEAAQQSLTDSTAVEFPRLQNTSPTDGAQRRLVHRCLGHLLGRSNLSLTTTGHIRPRPLKKLHIWLLGQVSNDHAR